ncbi:MAG: rbsRA [Firmicutes bacterium]|nr:rbsRA [Bacillota bacterium]
MNNHDFELQGQILNQIPTTVIAVDKDFKIIYANIAAAKMTGVKSQEDLLGKHCYDFSHNKQCRTPECCVFKAMEDGKMHSTRGQTSFSDGSIVYIEQSSAALIDNNGNIIGGLEFVLDVTQRVLDEERLAEQSYTIREMSTPTIKLWEGVLLLPVVGVIDSDRAQHMMDSMLNKILETSSRVIILDIHGVASVDTAVANHIIKITKATRLMGCECLLSGISASVAQTIVQLGIEMGSIKTTSTLSDALEEALAIINLEVISKK